MEKQHFLQILEKNSTLKERIRQSAHELHRSVNQTYGDTRPYGFHLDMVVGNVCDYGHLVCNDDNDIMAMIFGGYYHDSIEDARLTYHDVMNIARTMLTEERKTELRDNYLRVLEERQRPDTRRTRRRAILPGHTADAIRTICQALRPAGQHLVHLKWRGRSHQPAHESHIQTRAAPLSQCHRPTQHRPQAGSARRHCREDCRMSD